MADCIHHLDICPDCGGLDVVRLDEMQGVTGGTLTLGNGGEIDLSGATFYIGPASTPCETPQA
jgi:hypothetical protein